MTPLTRSSVMTRIVMTLPCVTGPRGRAAAARPGAAQPCHKAAFAASVVE
jgi:hypothetical protein